MRDNLKERRWAQLVDSIAKCESELRELEEVAAAQTEFDETRQLTEDELSSALISGRSLKQIGKKTTISFADNSYVVEVLWDHSGLKDGMERLRCGAAVD